MQVELQRCSCKLQNTGILRFAQDDDVKQATTTTTATTTIAIADYCNCAATKVAAAGMVTVRLDGCGEGDGEEVLGVLPGVGGVEVGGGEEGFDGGGGEFVTVFGVDGFAGGEVRG